MTTAAGRDCNSSSSGGEAAQDTERRRQSTEAGPSGGNKDQPEGGGWVCKMLDGSEHLTDKLVSGQPASDDLVCKRRW